MKFLLISPSHTFGGVEKYALQVGAAASDRFWEVHAAFPDLSDTQSMIEDFKKIGAIYHPLDICDDGWKRKTLSGHLARFFRSLSLLSKLHPDAVQINVPFLDKCFSSIVACGFLRIPTQVVFHLAPIVMTINFVPKFKIFNDYFRKLVLWAKVRNQDWVTVSKHNQMTVGASYGISEGGIRVVYNGIKIPDHTDFVREKSLARTKILNDLGLSDENQLVLTVGRLDRQKGYHDLIEVVNELRELFPKIRFLWAGEGALRPYIEEVISRQGLQETVLLLGHRDDIPILLKACDIFVFPSHYEGFPFALLEAMAHHIPVVATAACGIPELADSHVHGLLCPVGDRECLTKSIAWALEHPVLMREMADNAYVRVQKFTEEKMLVTALSGIEDLRSTSTNA